MLFALKSFLLTSPVSPVMSLVGTFLAPFAVEVWEIGTLDALSIVIWWLACASVDEDDVPTIF